MKSHVMSSREYINVAAELDASKDDFGPSIEDCLNMGSFAEDDTPPRHSKRKQGSSPAYGAPYGGYPPFRSPPGYPPHHPYYPPQAYPSYYPPRGYPPIHDQGNWSSPSNYDYPGHRPEPIPQSSSPPGKKSRWNQSTPEKKKGPSPFRSPPDDHKYKKSPLFQGTPSIGVYGSFGVDTPGGSAHLGEFSPMGPAFANFDSGALGNFQLSKSSSGEEPVGKPEVDRTEDQYADHLLGGILSPFVGNIQIHGSPLRPGRSERKPLFPSSLKKSSTPASKSRYSFSSPLGSNAIMQQKPSPWFTDSNAPGPMRLELGDMGAKRNETRRGLEGINNMLRGDTVRQRPAPSSALLHRHTQNLHHADAQASRGPTYPSRSDIKTPVKMSHPNLPLSGNRGATSYTPSSVPNTFISGVHDSTSRYPGSGNRKSPPAGKENVAPMSCNCKKSNCLKLYCICFAAERFCDGCNCNDCRNASGFEEARIKAMKDCRNKNPNAFKSKIDHSRVVAQGPPGVSPQSIHNMGCKCKKSECLKKYCECFQNGVMCGSKCKCVDCRNYGGSQALIDKRRKIKDHRGAEIAMRVADETWKGKHIPTPLTVPRQSSMPSPAQNRRPPHMLQPHPAMHPSPSGPRRGNHPQYSQPHYMLPPVGYSPMGGPHGTPNYMHGKVIRSRHPDGRPTQYPPPYSEARQPHMIATPKTLRTPAIRLAYDPKTSKKNRKLPPGTQEPTYPYFDKLPEQPKTTALSIFSYLSNDEMYNAGLVCKLWSRLAIDEELWELPQF